jgi:hypothetical protein
MSSQIGSVASSVVRITSTYPFPRRSPDRALGAFLMEELYSFVGEGWEQEDDITLLTLKRSTSLR